MTANVIYLCLGDPASSVESGEDKNGVGGLEAKVREKKGKKRKRNQLAGELKKDEVILFLLRSGGVQGDLQSSQPWKVL